MSAVDVTETNQVLHQSLAGWYSDFMSVNATDTEYNRVLPEYKQLMPNNLFRTFCTRYMTSHLEENGSTPKQILLLERAWNGAKKCMGAKFTTKLISKAELATNLNVK